MGAIRTLIVDDHPILQKAIRVFCNGQDDLEVIGEAGDGAEAIRMARELKPDMVILEAVMNYDFGRYRQGETPRRPNSEFAARPPKLAEVHNTL